MAIHRLTDPDIIASYRRMSVRLGEASFRITQRAWDYERNQKGWL